MNCRRALETKIANTDVTPQAMRPIAKSLMKRDGAEEPTQFMVLSALLHPLEKANATADCLENQFTPHDLCDENHKRQVEARVQTLLEAAGNNSPEKIRPCDVQKLENSLKLRKACGIDGIPNGCLRQLPGRPLVHLTHLTNHCLQLSHFLTPWKEGKFITLPKPGKDSKFPQNLRPISLLSTTGKLFEKVIIQIVQRHTGKKGLLNAGQFGFRALHSTTLQCMRLMDHVTLNFNNMSTAAVFLDIEKAFDTTLNFNNMSTAAVFLDIEKAFDTTWHYGLLHKLSKMNFPASLIKLISSFLLIENSLFQWKAKCLLN
jgi:hypothetical protein